MKQNRLMKGFFSRVTVMLALLLFTATAAVADDFGQQVLAGSQNQTVASDDDTEPIKIVYENTGFEVCSKQEYSSANIEQFVTEGSLTQTVIAGDYIEQTVIRYENTGFSESECPEITWSSTNFYNNFGLSKIWTKGPACTISGRMRDDISAGTYNAYIVVRDIDNKLFKTEFTFIVQEKPLTLTRNEAGGPLNQSVRVGNSITPIVFDYEGMEDWDVSGLPDGLSASDDENNHRITISGTIDQDVIEDDYPYQVTIKNSAGKECVLSGTISVEGDPNVTIVRVIENENQKVVAGNAIKPIVFKYQNPNFGFDIRESSLKGNFTLTDNKEKHELTVEGTVDESLRDGLYSIAVLTYNIEGERCKAYAHVEVTHKPVVTSVRCIENETQTVYAGGTSKPIVFVVENYIDYKVSNFPGGFAKNKRGGDTIAIVANTPGNIERCARGLYNIVLSVKGQDNNAAGYASINVIPVPGEFHLEEGNDNQMVAAGSAISPVVYELFRVKGIECTGLPLGLKGESITLDEEYYNSSIQQWEKRNQYIISGTVAPGAEAKEYTYTITATDYYDEVTTKTGKIRVVASTDNPGDANGDGDITMADANMVVNYFLAADKSQVSNFNLSAADVNHDGKITMADANQIVNMFLGNGK